MEAEIHLGRNIRQWLLTCSHWPHILHSETTGPTWARPCFSTYLGASKVFIPWLTSYWGFPFHVTWRLTLFSGFDCCSLLWVWLRSPPVATFSCLAEHPSSRTVLEPCNLSDKRSSQEPWPREDLKNDEKSPSFLNLSPSSAVGSHLYAPTYVFLCLCINTQ